MNNILSKIYYGNTVGDYFIAIILFFVVLGGFYFLRGIIFSHLKKLAGKTKIKFDDFLVEMISKIKAPEYQLFSFYFASRHLSRSYLFDKLLNYVILVVLTYRASTLVIYTLLYFIRTAVEKKKMDEASQKMIVSSSGLILQIAVWCAAAAFVLDNMGINITAVITGLGIGGVAIALASQNILGDLFNFFVILLDKPFILGDFVILENGSLGTIEYIGLKSTRIRSLSGEQIVLSNSKLLSQEIKNYKKMEKRRVVFKLGVIYQTPPEKLKKVPSIVKEIISSKSDAVFDRANMSDYGDFSINFEFVYYVLSGDYNLYMNIHESILLDIMDSFLKENIEFAYPTQTLYINKESYEK